MYLMGSKSNNDLVQAQPLWTMDPMIIPTSTSSPVSNINSFTRSIALAPPHICISWDQNLTMLAQLLWTMDPIIIPTSTSSPVSNINSFTRSIALSSPHICISWAHRPNNDLVQAQPLCWSLIIWISSITATSSINNKQEFVKLFEIQMRPHCAPHILPYSVFFSRDPNFRFISVYDRNAKIKTR